MRHAATPWAIGAVVLLLLVRGASAAPTIASVTGIVSGGGSVTLTGSGFGVKSPAAPILWDDFQDGAAGQALQGRWTAYCEATYSADRPYGVGSQSAKLALWSSAACGAVANIGDQARVYLSYNFFHVGGFDTAVPCIEQNTKMARLANDLDVHRSPYMGYTGNCPTYSYVFNPGEIPLELYGKPSDYWYVIPLDQWNRDEYYLDISTPDVADGQAFTWRNQEAMGYAPGIVTCSSSAAVQPCRVNNLFLPFYSAVATGVTIWVDNVYLDNTRARVELGNASSFAAVTHAEIQVPSAWADAAATVTVNQGTFFAGDHAFLFVIDANGVASDGFGVDLGGTPRPRPASPTAIRVQ